jgi:hypothetical protein
MLIEAFNMAQTFLCEMQNIFLISFNKGKPNLRILEPKELKSLTIHMKTEKYESTEGMTFDSNRYNWRSMITHFAIWCALSFALSIYLS